jgi:hypothetical protein
MFFATKTTKSTKGEEVFSLRALSGLYGKKSSAQLP